jgi:hypothetical protein
MSLSGSSDEFAESSPFDTAAASAGDDANAVGLSDPQYSQGRRRMLDLVNKLHSTGSARAILVESVRELS